MLERKIVIGLITSTEFCLNVKNLWNINLIESATAKQLALWVWEFFNKYNKAPGKEIETIFYNKKKSNKLSDELAKEIEEDILPGLSAEYESEEFNLKYLIEETRKYFNERNIKLLTDNIKSLLSSGEVDKAEILVRDFKPLGVAVNDIDNFILTASQIRRKNKCYPTTLIKPWLKEGQTTIIYGTFGSGKSLLTISIAYVLGLEDYTNEENDIGEWMVKNPTGTLYIDGELGEREMEERVKQFEWLGRQSAEHKLRILAIPEYQLETEDSFYLSDRTNQLKIIKWFKENPTYKLVILDSVSTLFGLKEENDNSEWNNKVSPLIRDLRALGVACIMLHHSGKEGKRGLRGASAMGAMAHNIFRLTNHGNKNIDDGEAWFTLSKDKQRASGFSFKTFSLKYTQDVEQLETHWEVTEN